MVIWIWTNIIAMYMNVEWWILDVAQVIKKIASTPHSKCDAKQIKASAFQFSERSRKKIGNFHIWTQHFPLLLLSWGNNGCDTFDNQHISCCALWNEMIIIQRREKKEILKIHECNQIHRKNLQFILSPS